LLASAGVAGVAIGLAAQNIVRDVLNGVLILVEDQFNVGDTVKVSGVSGVVESMTLRRTNLRDIDGTLHIIPNSQILQVSNQSVGATVATVNVSLDYATDPDKAMAMLRQIAEELVASPEYAPVVKEPPQVLGLEAVKGSELVFAVSFTTQATKQFALLREFRRRVRLQAEADGIHPGDAHGLFRTVLGERTEK
jgi:small conductance mechanosensitive channel